MLEKRLHRLVVTDAEKARCAAARAAEAPFHLGRCEFGWDELSHARDVAKWARLDGPDSITGTEDHAVLRWFDNGRPVLFVG